MARYLVLYPKVRVYTLVRSGFFLTSIALPAWSMLLYWMAIQLISGLVSLSRKLDGGVAFFRAHRWFRGRGRADQAVSREAGASARTIQAVGPAARGVAVKGNTPLVLAKLLGYRFAAKKGECPLYHSSPRKQQRTER